jgi:hypothetical protein
MTAGKPPPNEKSRPLAFPRKIPFAGLPQCWLALRGKGYRRQAMGVEQVLHAPVREHSRKPDEICERIERLVGDVPRIELFAREQRPGWSAWGDEIRRFRARRANDDDTAQSEPGVVITEMAQHTAEI